MAVAMHACFFQYFHDIFFGKGWHLLRAKQFYLRTLTVDVILSPKIPCALRAILQESEAKLEIKNFKPPSIFVWR